MTIAADAPPPPPAAARRTASDPARSVARRRGWAPSPWLALGVVAVAALAIRLAFLFRAPVFIIGDSENYFWPGYQLARGIGFDLDLRRTPMYPLFIAAVVLRIGEDLSALALAQHALGVVTAVLVAWLGLRLYGPWAGLLAGVLAGVAAPLLVAEHYVMAEALFIPLATVAVAWLVWAIERVPSRAVASEPRPAVASEPPAAVPRVEGPPAHSRDGAGRVVADHAPAVAAISARPGWRLPLDWPMLVSGLLIGLAGLTRPAALVLLVALGIALLVQERSLRRAVVRGLPALLGVALFFLPWMARNAVVHDTFSADGNGGQTLVGRAMRHDRGFAFDNPDDPDPARRRAREIMREGRGQFVSPVREKIKRELGLDDRGANRLMRDLALEAILRQPDHFVLGTARNLVTLAAGIPDRSRDHWATRRQERNREEWEGHLDIRHLLGPPTSIQEAQYAEADALINVYQPARLGLILPLLALVGAAALAMRGRAGVGAFLALTAFGLLLAGVTLVAPLPRYRYPAEPLFGLLAAGGLAWLVTLARGALTRRRHVGRPVAA